MSASTYPQPISGLWVPCLTPFDGHGDVAPVRFAELGRSLLKNGASGLVPFGSTGEANSLSLGERERLLDELLAQGIPAEQVLPGTGSCALPDAVRLTRRAVAAGCRGVLVLPPFYYKPASEDGLFAFYSELIERVGSERLRLYLYHIPHLSGVPITEPLIDRLRAAYPDAVAGVKDSTRDWENTRELLERFPDLTVVPGNGKLLLPSLAKGARGCIAAIGNLIPRALDAICTGAAEPDADTLQQHVTEFEDAVRSYSTIPAMKALLGDERNAWSPVRPPLQPLSPKRAAALRTEVRKLDLDAPPMSAS